MASFDYESRIVSIPDYPKPGVIFKDITPLFDDPVALSNVVDDIADHFLGQKVTKVVGAEARGFLIGAPVAYKLGAGFVPARKPGKLPRDVYSQSYALEYGTDELQIHKDALSADDNVLIVDDLVATGGTAIATAKLVEQSGAKIQGFSFILELSFLNPRQEISKDYGNREVYTLVKVQ
ncbi:MAG: adenine phosphoribosyltransferase [Tractidigestivibacter sp.]|jgi:adenine phosphoribosyltransferase|uniref:adenine phosphoribosyltransferase n=1 Tax=Tractidigestivibacter sp. TaxID=2847320 RepID=UPI003D8CECC2